jgi:hypothetical protein
MNIGLALGVLRSANEEYIRGLAIDYHLSVSAAVFADLLAEFEATRLEACAKIRNEAAHGGSFTYRHDDVTRMLGDIRDTLSHLFGHK